MSDLFSNFSFFKRMQEKYTPEFLPDAEFAEAIDTEYFYNWVGDQTPSALVKAIAINGVVTPDGLDKLVTIVYSHFHLKWLKTFKTLSFEYNPIHNVDETEHGNSNDNFGRVVDNTGENHNRVNAFDDNSIDGVPSDSNEYSHNETNSGNDAHDFFRHREGNIGVTSTQNLITQERDVWQWDYIYQLFIDTDSILTSRVYEVDEGELI